MHIYAVFVQPFAVRAPSLLKDLFRISLRFFWGGGCCARACALSLHVSGLVWIAGISMVDRTRRLLCGEYVKKSFPLRRKYAYKCTLARDMSLLVIKKVSVLMNRVFTIIFSVAVIRIECLKYYFRPRTITLHHATNIFLLNGVVS